MKSFSEKVYLSMPVPAEEDSRSDHLRLLQALAAEGFENVKLPLRVLRKLHKVCLKGEYKLTAALVYSMDGWTVSEVESGDTRGSHYGLAVDYGSTTIVMELVDLHSGAVIARRSRPNDQRRFGTDILTRITFAMEDEANADALRMATVETFNLLMEEITGESGVDAKRLPVMILSGNTAMIHFLLGLDGWTVFASPYAPVTANPDMLWGRELDMDFSGLVYIVPAAGNYVGGDIVSGLLNMDFYKKDELGVFFDIGTNGELVMGNKDWLIAGAGAAGPALEGYISRFGVRAQEGAVDSVSIEGGILRYTTIGGMKPIGICGSGIIDLIAQMRLNGWINIAGELNPEASARIRIPDGETEYAAVYAETEESGRGGELYFSQTDIRQYLETKAAAHTMVDCLLEAAGCTEKDIDRFYLSGAFSVHSNLESAITVGIFPDLPRDKYALIKNASLDGARMLLLNRDRLEEIRSIKEVSKHVNLGGNPVFNEHYMDQMFFPEEE